jgi:hypoxanthine phosphoribosyltransferase
VDKPSRREVPIEVDFVGFTIPDVFIVGYGIDYAISIGICPSLRRSIRLRNRVPDQVRLILNKRR